MHQKRLNDAAPSACDVGAQCGRPSYAADRSVVPPAKLISKELIVKRILKLSVRTTAIVAAVFLVAFALAFERETHAGQIINYSNGGYYYAPGYGNYPVYGQGPYAYGTSGGSGYQTYGAGPYRYGPAVNETIRSSWGPYRRSYYGPNGIMTYNGSYGFRGFDNYGN
jgi:hypothetical protein